MTMYVLVDEPHLRWDSNGEFYLWSEAMEELFKQGNICSASLPTFTEGDSAFYIDGIGQPYCEMSEDDALWMKLNADFKITDIEPAR